MLRTPVVASILWSVISPSVIAISSVTPSSPEVAKLVVSIDMIEVTLFPSEVTSGSNSINER